MYGNLVNARTDVGDMTPLELLRIDIKFAGNIPVPGFPILVEVRTNKLKLKFDLFHY